MKKMKSPSWEVNSLEDFTPFKDYLKRGNPRQPLPPPKGIPKQKLPKVFRLILKSLILPFLYLDDFVQRVAR